MPQEIARTAYTIRELSEEAREKALGNHRDWNTGLTEWWDWSYEDFVERAKEKGFEINEHSVPLYGGGYGTRYNIWFSGFSNQGDGLAFEARVDVERFIKSRKLGKKYRMILANMREGWSVYADVEHRDHRYYHAYTMYATVESDFDTEDEARYLKFYDLLEELEDDIQEEARDLAQEFYYDLQRECEYLESDEAVGDSLEANEYLFNEDGADL